MPLPRGCSASVLRHCVVGAAGACRASDACCGGSSFCEPDGHRPFYEYYQIGGADESVGAEAEPEGGEELRGRYEGSHSLFGFVWQVADATGWSVRYIMEELNYQTLVMMLSDAPQYRSFKKRGMKSVSSAEEEAAEIAGIFRSRLTQ